MHSLIETPTIVLECPIGWELTWHRACNQIFVLKLYIASIIVLLFGESLLAEPCLDRDRTLRLNRLFDFRTYDPGVVDNLCDSKNPLYPMLKALMAMEDLPPLTGKTDAADQGIIRGSPFDFFRARVRRIIFEPTSQSYCAIIGRSHVSAYAGTFGSGIIHICRTFTEDPFIDQMSDLLHEARHLDSGVGTHVQCNHGSFLGLRGCDATYEEKGAYAVGLEFLLKLSRTESLPEAIRAEARAKAVTDFANRFNHPPLDISAGALLLRENGEIHFYSNKSAVKWNGPSASALAIRDGVPVALQSSVDNLQISVDGNHWRQASGNLAEKYLGLTQNERRSVADIFYSQPGADYSCILFESSMRCWSDGLEEHSVTNWQFRARRFVYGSNSALLPPKSLNILADDGFLYRLPAKFSELKRMAPSNYNRIQNIQSLLGAVTIGKRQELILNTDGQALIYSRQERNSIPISELSGFRFKKVISPYYWSPALQDL